MLIAFKQHHGKLEPRASSTCATFIAFPNAGLCVQLEDLQSLLAVGANEVPFGCVADQLFNILILQHKIR
jgi:hypothetical protein